MLASEYRKAQYLSLDIVIGAVILLRFFSSHFGIIPSFVEYFLLGASVWLIYTFDHLRDAAQLTDPSRGRYQFHQKHNKTLKLIAIGLVCAMVIFVFYLDKQLLIVGSILAIFSGCYLFIQGVISRFGLKELYVAIVYSLGILLVPFVNAWVFDWVIFLQLFLLTFTNLTLFSWFEREEDAVDHFQSIATVAGAKLDRILLILIAGGLTLAMLQDFSSLSGYFIIAFLVYGLLFVFHGWARRNGRFRSLGDGVFLLPILFR